MATVLIIDDSHLGRTHAGLAFKDTSHRLITAHDGVEALAMIASDRPDCVVLNQHTPALSTEEILDRISANPAPVRVIVRGTALTDATIDAYRARGADVVLNGPVDDSALLDAIETCIEHTPFSRAS